MERTSGRGSKSSCGWSSCGRNSCGRGCVSNDGSDNRSGFGRSFVSIGGCGRGCDINMESSTGRGSDSSSGRGSSSSSVRGTKCRRQSCSCCLCRRIPPWFQLICVTLAAVAVGGRTVSGSPAAGESLRSRVNKRDVIDGSAEDYLTRYGYLPQSDLETGALRTLQQLEDAVRNLQGFAGLEMTGKIDGPTKQLMQKPRCGVQDISLGYRNRRGLRVKRYSLQGQRWSHTNLTWSLRKGPENSFLTRDAVRRELTYALEVWARQTRLTFTEEYDSDRADIQIYFHRNYHGDGYPFDGPGSVLAHAFFPGAGRGGDAHFDDDENWSELREINRQVTSLFAVAVHEFGHSLGLSHSSVETSLMYPWYSSVPEDYRLPADDKLAIQHLYGNLGGHYPALEVTKNPPIVAPKTTTPTPPPSTTPLNDVDEEDSVPQKCHTNFDAVAVIRSEMWAFKGRYFWRINREGGTREDPVELSSFWYGLPSDIDHVDAVYERTDHDIVFFVGGNFYVMSGNSQLKYGPLPITRLGLPSTLDRVDGAMRWGWNDKTYFFSGTMYWRFDEDAQSIELDYPRDMVMWKGVPYHIDSVFQYTDKKTYFFKDKHFWTFNDQKMEVEKDTPVPVGEYWLNCPKEIQDPFKKAAVVGGAPSHRLDGILLMTLGVMVAKLIR